MRWARFSKFGLDDGTVIVHQPNVLTISWALLGCCFGLLANCAPESETSRPNVLLISIDTTRADALGCYGSEFDCSPFVDSLAESGVLFEAAFAPVPMTLPSHTTMLTGLDPSRHQVHDNTVFHVPDDAQTIAEILQERGYKTHAAVASLVLSSRYGLDQGFQTYDDMGLDSDNPADSSERPAAEVVDAISSRLQGDSPWFAFVHLYDPHQPFNPPPDLAKQFDDQIRNLYFAEIAAADRAIERLVTQVRTQTRRSTLIILTSDHGEGRGEHYETTHGHLLHDATQRVPLIIQHADFAPGRSTTLVSLADITPTILDILDIEEPPLLDGSSLVPLLRGEELERDAVVYLETMATLLSYDLAPLYGVRTPDWKLVIGAKPRLFDLRQDPKENTNVATKHPEIVAKLSDRLLHLRDNRGPKLTETRRALNEQELEALGALGYVVGHAANLEEDYQDRPDPYDHARNLMLYNDTKIKMQSGDLAGAITGYEQLNQALPRVFLFRQNLAVCYEYAGKPRLAYREFIAANECRPNLLQIQVGMGVNAQKIGKTSEARHWLEQAIEHATCPPRAYLALWNNYYQAGETALANSIRKQVLSLDLEPAIRAQAEALPQ